MGRSKREKLNERRRRLHANKKAAGLVRPRKSPERRAEERLEAATWRAEESPHWEKPKTPEWRLKPKRRK